MRKTYLPLLTAAILAVAALTGPAMSAAAQCPPGQTGTPPYCQAEPPKPPPPPAPPSSPPIASNAVTTEASGTVNVALVVSGPGTLKLSGHSVKGETITVDKAGNVIVKLKATGKVLQHLQNRGWTRPKQIFVTFTASDGTMSKIKIVVRFRRQ